MPKIFISEYSYAEEAFVLVILEISIRGELRWWKFMVHTNTISLHILWIALASILVTFRKLDLRQFGSEAFAFDLRIGVFKIKYFSDYDWTAFLGFKDNGKVMEGV